MRKEKLAKEPSINLDKKEALLASLD